MTYFLRDGNIFNITNEAALDIHEKLPAGNFIIKKNPLTGALYLEQIENFPAIGKVYGNATERADRILNTFKDRSASTGVMLTGEKGSGKTLLAKSLAIAGAAEGMPTIVINQPWIGDQFNQLIQAITQPAIVLFDEFEKVYDSEQQESILTLLDGVFPSKKLFLLTCNDKWRVDSHMRNRPGRIYYMIDFKGLEAEFIKEYCEDRLNNKAQIPAVVKVAAMFNQFNFDMLKALVEEMNRYNEDPFSALDMLNAKPTNDESGKYDIKVEVNGEKQESVWPHQIRSSPLAQEQIHIQYTVTDPNAPKRPPADEDDFDYDEDEGETVTLLLSHKDLKRMDEKTGSFVYVPKDGVVVTFVRVQDYAFNYRSLAF